jgi:hypothetical protein
MIGRLTGLWLVLVLGLSAEVLIQPEAAMQAHFSTSDRVEKKSFLIASKAQEAIAQEARTPLKSRLHTLYRAFEGDQILGYGLILTEKIRTKNAAVLFLFDADRQPVAAEIIAFYEPREYIPSEKWLAQLSARDDTPLVVGRDLPAISGATLSAGKLADLARTARAILKHGVKP